MEDAAIRGHLGYHGAVNLKPNNEKNTDVRQSDGAAALNDGASEALPCWSEEVLQGRISSKYMTPEKPSGSIKIQKWKTFSD